MPTTNWNSGSQKWPLLFVLSGLFMLACVVVMATYLAIISVQVHEGIEIINVKVNSMKKRIQDLESENDYLFEEEKTISSNSKKPIMEKLKSELPDLCLLQFDPGPCGSRITRWFYSNVQQDCLEFPWSGCRGNENNFLSLIQCRAACKVPLTKSINKTSNESMKKTLQTNIQPIKSLELKNICQLSPHSGPCKGRIPRYFHFSGRCLRFFYGGCGGNENNFFTVEDCRKNCLEKNIQERKTVEKNSQKICNLHPESGSCDADDRENQNLLRYYYNSTTQKCQQFYYSGCGGNDNNFANPIKCRKICTTIIN